MVIARPTKWLWQSGTVVSARVDVPRWRPEPVVVLSGGSYRLRLVSVGLACCGLEYDAGRLLAQADPGSADDGAEGADRAESTARDVLVVAGTVTDTMKHLVVAAYEKLGPACAVISFGACSATGGPYWDSYAVTPGIGDLIPVDRWVPGCPPRPEALLAAVASLAEER